MAATALGQAMGIGQAPPGGPGGGGAGGGAPSPMGGPPGAPPGIGMMGSPGMQAPGQNLANFDTSQFGGV
jgi:hypothetical protein